MNAAQRDAVMVAREHQHGGGEEIGGDRAGRDRIDPAGLGVRAVEQAGDEQRGGEREAGHEIERDRRRFEAQCRAMPGNAHSTPNTTAVMASQRHSRARASANEAAVTTAR